MAKLVKSVKGDFNQILQNIENGILNSSISATLEEAEDFRGENSRCSVRVFERFSYYGSNRVSMTVTLFQEANGIIYISGITAGGSRAMFFKLNTIGEEAFLDKLREIL